MHRLALATLLLPLLHAQTPSGKIQVEVKDPSGAPIEASGNLTGPANIRFRTGANGQYSARDLPYGAYKLEISKTGFTTQSLNIDVQSETQISRTIILAI